MIRTPTGCVYMVALRKESVDRNSKFAKKVLTSTVALRKESVDRNIIRITAIDCISRSLSARRAWIEIAQGWRVPGRALRRSPQGERG